MTAIALIPTDLERSRFGLRSRLHDQVRGASILAHTVRRAAQISQVDKVVLVHPDGQDPMKLLGEQKFDRPVTTFADPNGLRDRHTPRWIAARKWAQTAWRGGLGGATAFDELLPAGPLVAAMKTHGADSALIARCDWCLLDPKLAERVLAIHLESPDAMKLTFSQAPPGLCGVATNTEVLGQLRDHHAGFGIILGYNPAAPVVDPIGREVNHPIPAGVRDCNRRFVYDTPRSVELINAIADRVRSDFAIADAEQVCDTCRLVEAAGPTARLPQQVTLELTPRRVVTGSIAPQHYVDFERPDLDADLAGRICEQLGAEGDIALRLGGLGDALLHPLWDQIALGAHESGVLGVAVETDLHCDRDVLERLLELPIDVVVVRLNADTAETYERTCGSDRFKSVLDNLEFLFNTRNAASRDERGQPGLPWIIPSMVKTSETLTDLESFFDKWMLVSGHAVIEPSRCGCGLMPDLSPVSMAAPRRRSCRQLGERMTILSDGCVALCDQDWLGTGSLGDTRIAPLIDIWQNVQPQRLAHTEGRFAELALCGKCHEWHRP